MKLIIAPSILSADYSKLGSEIRRVEKAGADWIHVDVMDGHFVPNITIGVPVVANLSRVTRLPLDVHLMIEEPLRHIAAFAKAGADTITIHSETVPHLRLALQQIKKLGVKAGVSIKPKTPLSQIRRALDLADMVLLMTVEPGFGGQAFMPQILPKVRELRSYFKKRIQVDGGINPETARLAVAAGADTLVAGASVFGKKNLRAAIAALRAGA